MTCFIVVLAVCAPTFMYLTRDNQTADLKTAHSLMTPGNCQKALPMLAKIQPSNKNPKETEELLTYRSSCYIKNRQYGKALSDVKWLQKTYLIENEKEKAQALNNEVSFLSKASKDLNYHSSVRNEEVSNDFAKKLESENDQ